MNPFRIVFIVFFFVAAALPKAAAQSPAEATVTIGPEDSGNWSVAYSFEDEHKVLAFVRSESDFRGPTWTLESEDARFGRVAGIDVIVFDEPADEVSFSIIPLTSNLEADYTPFVTFTDGSIAVYEGQFSLAPLESLEAVDALDGDTSNIESPALAMDVVMTSDRPIIADGRVFEDRIRHRIEGDGTYLYTGNGKIETFDSFTAVLDARLPAWLRERFAADLGEIFAGYETRWGFELENKATVMLAYKGAGAKGFNATGGALDQLLMMEVGGADLSAPDDDLLSYLHWFFAHEAAHLFQIDKGVSFAGGGESWIHEGAANTMAYGLIASMMDGPGAKDFLGNVYGRAFDECVGALEGGSLATAKKRDVFSAHYSCGDFVALASDGFLKRRDLYGFWNRMIAQAKGNDARKVTLTTYFATLQILGATPAQIRHIERVVDGRPGNARKALTDLLDAAGLDPQFSAGGQLISLDWPDYSAE